MVLALTLLLLSAHPVHANVGSITELRGQGEIVRGKQKITATSRLPIAMRDLVRTGNGRVQITFQDNSKVKVTEQSKLVIDDFVYDPKTNGGKMGIRFAQGTARFIGGKMNRPNINLKTPTATIGVRGTDFTTTVDETGKSMFILLPGEDGHVGEIMVSTDAGIVILNRAFQSTTVITSDSAPSRPVILDISLSMIDNMIIVTPPSVVSEDNSSDSSKSVDSEMFELAQDFLKDDSLSDTLDREETDELADSYLEDTSTTPRPAPVKVAVAQQVQAQPTVAPIEVITPPVSPTIVVQDIIEPVVSATEDINVAFETPAIETATDSNNEVVQRDFELIGTNFGYDQTTLIDTKVDDTSAIEFYRETSNIVSIKSNTSSAINILINDNNNTYNVILNDATNIIRITQKN